MFYIIEQGNRIATPVDKLLNSQRVTEVTASSAIRRINEKDGVKAARLKGYVNQQGLIEQKKPRAKAIHANELMSSPVVTALLSQTLDEVCALFSRHGFHHLPIVDAGQRLQGIVSDRDILRFSANAINDRHKANTPISQLMTKAVISGTENTRLRVIAEVMCQNGIGAIPIIGDAVEVIGIVSRTDILRSLVQDQPIELWT